MVLGGGFSNDNRLFPIDQISPYSLCRLAEGIHIHRLIPGSKIVLSGDGIRVSGNQADLMAQAAISLGVDPSFIEKLTRAHNTNDEAKRFYSTFGTKGSLILVTDAIHITRAMKLFRKAGLFPVAAPTNHLNKKDSEESRFTWIPSAINIHKMELAMHEYEGIAWIWVGGE